MIIDFHTHVFPEKIAERTIEKLSFVSGGLIPQTNGTLKSLKELMNKDGVDKSVTLSIATNEKQQTAVQQTAEEKTTAVQKTEPKKKSAGTAPWRN